MIWEKPTPNVHVRNIGRILEEWQVWHFKIYEHDKFHAQLSWA